MSKNHLRNIVLEAKTIKQQNNILARKLTKTIEERFSKITEHYDPEYLKNIINETVLNRTSDSVQELSRELLNNLRYGKVHETTNEGWADFGRAAGNFLVGKETTAGIRKLAGMATGRATGSMSREDIIARDQYIKDFTSKVSAAIDSGVKSGVLVKAPAAAPNQAQAVAEATTRSQTISSYVVSTVEYYAQQAGVISIDQFRPTIESLAQQIEQTYPRGAKQLVKKLANVVYSLTSSTMQQGARDENLTQKTDQVMDLINSMNKPDDIDDVAHIAKAALQKLYKGDQVMMSRMFNAVEVKAQERMGK